MEKAENQKAMDDVIKLATEHGSCHFEEGTTEKSVPLGRDFSSFFVEMTILIGHNELVTGD
ncbi:hypothetical protein [uncultured Draconibacterium sp.]|uniref:hypothetical protein n=1 Tax=uncultured Draconibacterium sp. TaxID=1573823 RepID=UPI002AA6BF80|nr:hypothetical protein [uncultured Draconibacterium sp.]